MKRFAALFLAAGIAGIASAETVSVPIPGENWQITFDAPKLDSHEDQKAAAGYAYRANAGRFNLTFFVERPSGSGTANHDVYTFYWPQASRNPMIAKKTIAKSETANYVRVQYDLVMKFEGKEIRARNVNYYFAHAGKWVDVHISVIEPTAEDQKIFDAFDAGLKYGTN